VFLNKYMSKDNRSRHPRYTTDAFEVATGVMNQAYVQCVALQPNNLKAEEQLQVPLDYLKQLPWQWQETRFVDGYPGRYAVVARKAVAGLKDTRGNDIDAKGQWYVAGLNGTNEPMTLQLQLPDVVAKQEVKALCDVVDKKAAKKTQKAAQMEKPANYDAQLTTLKVDKKGLLTITMQPHGGFVINY
jgi:hypothetical protein